MRNKIFFAICILLILGLGFLVIIQTPNNCQKDIKDIKEEKKIPETRQEIINDCQNKPLENTAKCLRDNIATFFYYNISNIGQRFDFYKQEDFERLKKQGGVCGHWADLYLSLARSLGFNTNRVPLNLGEGFIGSHVVLFMNDNIRCCVLNMLEFKCMELNKSMEEK